MSTAADSVAELLRDLPITRDEALRAVDLTFPAWRVRLTDETIRTGQEITTEGGGRRGVVVDGQVKKSGPNKGRVEVMWIGGRYTTAEWPAELFKVP